MTINTSRITLGTAASQVVSPSVQPQFVTMHNMTKSSNEYIYFGGPNVGTANAPHIDPGETLQIKLLPGESIFALSDPSGLSLGLFIQVYP